MNRLRITCALCRKPVQRVEWREDYENDRCVVRAYCHGKVDEQVIHTDMLGGLRHDRMAFSGEQREEGVPK